MEERVEEQAPIMNRELTQEQAQNIPVIPVDGAVPYKDTLSVLKNFCFLFWSGHEFSEAEKKSIDTIVKRILGAAVLISSFKDAFIIFLFPTESCPAFSEGKRTVATVGCVFVGLNGLFILLAGFLSLVR